MVIIKFLISEDFSFILAIENGYVIIKHVARNILHGVNRMESSMAKQNEIKPESAWAQTKKCRLDDAQKNCEIFHENEWKALEWMERTGWKGQGLSLYTTKKSGFLNWIENRIS